MRCNMKTNLLLKFAPAAVAGAALLGGTSAAQALIVASWDMNNLEASIDDGDSGTNVTFDADTFTGNLKIQDQDSNDPESILVDFEIDNLDSPAAPTFSADTTVWDLENFEADLTYDSGTLMGGSITIEVTDGTKTDKYTANVLEGGFDNTNPLILQGFTNGGEFDDTSHAGLDVSQFVANEPLSGEFFSFTFSSGDPLSEDNPVSVSKGEVQAVVPSPSAALAALPILGGILLRRRLRA